MKKLWYIGGIFVALALLTGCSAKTVQPVSFDHFSMQRYTNHKIYLPETTTDTSIIYQAKQQTTGIANSLIITKILLTSGARFDDTVTANYDQLQKKLTAYAGDAPSRYDTICDKIHLIWYDLSFSYTMEKTTFWTYQYFLQQEPYLYVISLHTNDNNDISYMTKSIKTIMCN